MELIGEDVHIPKPETHGVTIANSGIMALYDDKTLWVANWNHEGRVLLPISQFPFFELTTSAMYNDNCRLRGEIQISPQCYLRQSLDSQYPHIGYRPNGIGWFIRERQVTDIREYLFRRVPEEIQRAYALWKHVARSMK